jgi:hypothetical protein
LHQEDLKRLKKFSLYREAALDEIQGKLDSFLGVIHCAADQTADRYFCRVELSGRNLIPVQASYLDDLPKLKLDGSAKSRELDHFKHAAILTYWMCKNKPIHIVRHATVKRYDEDSSVSTKRLRELWSEFDSFHDELIAFFVGFHICNSHHLQKLAAKSPAFRKYVESLDNQTELLQLFEPSPEFLHDTVRIMHDNHMGVYAYNLLFRAMFSTSLHSNLQAIGKTGPALVR